MQVLESYIERTACRRIADLGVRNIKLAKVRGWPDRLFLIPGGKPLFIEFKRPGAKPRKFQSHIHAILRRLGYKVEIHDDATQAVEAVRRALEATRVPEKSR